MSTSFDTFKALVAKKAKPVVLLEGTRKVPVYDQSRLFDLGATLAKSFPNIIFRSGNAEGSDTFFARGVESLNPGRMQVLTPYKNHRKKNLHVDNLVVSLSDISPAGEEELANFTNRATPENSGMIDKRHKVDRLKAKANYLLRDTLKVVGDKETGLEPATAAIFYTSPDPMAGGTGHTIRVCQEFDVPVFMQQTWWEWIEDI